MDEQCCTAINLVMLMFAKSLGWDIHNDFDDHNRTWLHRAHNVEMAHWLIKEGFDLEQSDAYGNTPLMLAVTNKNLELFKFYCSKKANLKTTNNDRQTLLHAAIYVSNLEILPLLLKMKEIDINAQDNEKNTALHLAIQMKNILAVQLIIEKKPNLSLTNNKEELAWELALDLERLSFFKILMPYIDPKNIIVKNALPYALHTTIFHYGKNTEVIEWLIANGANLHETASISNHDNECESTSDLTALGIAVLKRNVIASHCLLQKGCSLTETDLAFIKKCHKTNTSKSSLKEKEKLIFELIELFKNLREAKNIIFGFQILNLIHDKIQKHTETKNNDTVELEIIKEPSIQQTIVKLTKKTLKIPSLKKLIFLKMSFFEIYKKDHCDLRMIPAEINEEYKFFRSNYSNDNLLDLFKIAKMS